MNRIFKVLTLVLIMTLCIGVIFTFVGCKDDKPENELQSISVIIGEGENKLILSADNANEDAIRNAISVTASFADKDIAEIIEQYEIVGFDANAEGEQNVTIKYNGFEQSIKVVINRPQAPTLSSIKIDKASVVLSESEATEAGLKSKIEVKAVYSDGSENAISDYTIEGFKADTEGEQSVTIKYSTVSATIKVTVEHPIIPQEPTLESIKVAPSSLTIAEAEASVDAIKGKIVVTAVYSDKSEEAVSDYTVEDFNADAEGEQSVTIKYSTVSTVIKVTIERPTEPEQIKIYVNTNTEGEVLSEYPSDDSNVVKQYSITIDLESGDLVTISAGKVEYNNYDKACGFKGVASVDGEYTFYVKFYQDGSHSIWVDKPASTDPQPYKVTLIVSDGRIIVMTKNVSTVEGVSEEYMANVTLKKDDTVTIKDSNDFIFVNYEEEYTTFRGTAEVDGEYTFYAKKYENGTHSIWVAVPTGEDPDPTPSPDTITVYFYNYKDWANVNAYAWVSGSDGKDWPGQAMTSVEGHDNWYQAEISGENNRILFNAGDNMPQTLNLAIDTNKLYYNGYEWTDGFNVYDGPLYRTIYYYNANNWSVVNAYTWTEFEGSEIRLSDWSGTQMTAVADHDGWYSIEIGIEYKSIIFNDGTNQTDNLNINDVDGLYYYNNGWTNGFGEFIDPDPTPTPDKVTVYFYNYKDWANVNAYAWVSGTDGKDWPGQPMTAVEGHDNWYQAEVSGENNRILFNAGDQMPQTLNLAIDANKLYYNGYEWTDGFNEYNGPLYRTIYYYNANKWSAVNAYSWDEFDESKIEFSEWSGTSMTAVVDHDGWYSIEIGIEFKSIIFNDGTNQTDNLDINDADGLYYYNNGWTNGFGESIDPVPTPSVPTITKNSEVYLVVGETKTPLAINNGSDVLEFMIEKVELEANSTFTITVDGQEINNYKEESDIKGTITETGDYCFYVSNDGIYVAPYTPPYTVSISINDGEPKVMTIFDSDNPNVTVQYALEINLSIGDKIVIKDSNGNTYDNYENSDFKGTATAWAGSYTVYLKLYSESSSIWVSIPIVKLDNASEVKISIGDTEHTLTLNDANETAIEYKLLNVPVTTEDVIKVYIGGFETANYKQNATIANGRVPENGNYNFYVDDDGIWVEKAQESTVDPTPNIPQEPTLESIKIDKTELTIEKANANIDYINDQITVTAVYSDKSETEVTGYSISELNAESYEAQTLTISYEGKTATLTVTIQKPAPVISSIEVNEKSITLSESEATEAVLKSKIVVKAVYSDESKEVVSDYTIEGFDADADGEQTVTIKYSTFSATIKVTVDHPVVNPDPTLESIKVTPSSLTIAEAEASIDAIKGKIVVTAVYSDKSEEIVTDYTVEGFSAEADGEQSITVKYSTVSTIIKVTIERSSVLPQEPTLESIKVNKVELTIEKSNASIEYIKEQIIVTAVYSDKSENAVSDYTISELDADNYAAQILTISYGGKTATLTVTIQKPAPVINSIKANQESVTLSESEATESGLKSKIEVKAVYSDEHEETVTDYSIEGLDASANGEQTVTIKYSNFTTTIKVTVEHPSKYYIYLNGNATEMIENAEADKADGKLAEYMVTINLNVGDAIVIKDSLENSYDKYDNEDFSGTARIQGSYTVYFKVYSDNCSIWVGIPSVTLTKESNVKIIIGDKEHMLTLNEDNKDAVEFKLLNVAVTTEDVIKVYIGEVETANYKQNAAIANGRVPEDGNYNFYVADNGIWVEKVQESTVDPDTPYSVSIIVNNDEPIVMTEAESDNANVTAQYTVTVTLKESDVVKIIDSTGFEFVNYEDTTSFKGTAASDGEYTFYVKKYKDGGDSIWVAVPTIVDPTPDVPVTGDIMTIYYYNLKGWSNVNAYAWNANGNNSWPGEKMTAVEDHDGWYSIEISTSYTSIIFNAGQGLEQSADIAIDADKHYFNGYEWTDGYNLYTKTTRTVYFKNTSNWNTVNAYAWQSNNTTNTNKSWPGVEMTAVDGHDGWYMLEISVDYDMIIFNNGSGTQTPDISYKLGSIYYDYSESKWVESF